MSTPLPTPEISALRKWAILIFLALIWGSSFILIKKGLVAFSPPQAAAIRLIAAFFTLVWFIYQSMRTVPVEKWIYLFISGMLGTFVPAFLFAYAQTQLESALAGVLNSLTPVFTFLIGWLFFELRVKLLAVVGLLLGFLGAVSLVLIGKDFSTISPNPYGLLVILATVMYGCNLNFVKRHLQGLQAIQIASLVMFFTAPLTFFTFFGTAVPNTVVRGTPESLWALGALVLLGVFSTGVATIFFNRLLLVSTPVFASSVTYLIPIVAIFWGLLDGEQLQPDHYLSMIVIIVGVWLINSSRNA